MKVDVDSLYEEMIREKARSMQNNSNFSEDDIEGFVTSEDYFKDDTQENRGSGNRLSKEDDESFVYKRYTTRREYKYTEQEMEAIRNGCLVTFVHDYVQDDFYHVSDEDRSKYDALAEISMKLGAIKSVYRRVDQYVLAMRTVYKAWEILATKNTIYTRDEFFKLVGKGKITSSKIILPALKNSNKYNMDKIMQYIDDEELDPEDLLPIKIEDINDTYYDDDEREDEIARIFSQEELELLDKLEKDDGNTVSDIKTVELKRKFVSSGDYYSSKSKHKLNKRDKHFYQTMAPVIKSIRNRNKIDHGYCTAVIDDLSKKDDDSGRLFDDIMFHGSWESDIDVRLYDIAVTDMMNDTPIMGERNLTYNDVIERKFYKTLSDHGINDIKIKRNVEGSGADETKRKKKQVLRENKIREEKFINRVTNLQGNPKFIKLIKKAKKDIETHRYADNDDD